MVKKFWFAISFFAAFFSVYMSVILYSIVPTIFKMDVAWGQNGAGNSFIYTANTTMSTASTATWLPTIGLVVAAAIIMGIITGTVSMKKAIEEEKF